MNMHEKVVSNHAETEYEIHTFLCSSDSSPLRLLPPYAGPHKLKKSRKANQSSSVFMCLSKH